MLFAGGGKKRRRTSYCAASAQQEGEKLPEYGGGMAGGAPKIGKPSKNVFNRTISIVVMMIDYSYGADIYI